MQPQSRAWFERLAKTQGGYLYPWDQVLEAPGGEQLFDALLEPLLTPQTHVLEAGCAEGKDAARFGSRAASWTGYDFVPEFLELARQKVADAEFVYWHSSKESPPESFQNRFDLVVSRRGPTSVIDHLPLLCRPNATVLGIHPWDEQAVEKVHRRLAGIGLEPDGEWLISVRGWLPTLADFLALRRFQADERAELELQHEWNQTSSANGFPIHEKRFVWMARVNAG